MAGLTLLFVCGIELGLTMAFMIGDRLRPWAGDTRVMADASRYQVAARAIERHSTPVEGLSEHPQTVITYLLNTWALRHTRSSQVALYINVQPIVAAALSTAMGKPMPGWRFFVALVLVSFALFLQTRRE